LLVSKISLGGKINHLTLKILTQKRVESLQRLLNSIEIAKYADGINIDVEIYIDGVDSADKEGKRLRKNVIKLAKEWEWQGKKAVVYDTEKKKKGVRGSWLKCSEPKIVAGEELSRTLIVEDDVELSEAWFEILSYAIENEAEGSAGISLQRQAFRLDAYANEIFENHGRTLLPLPNLPQVGLYQFAHVGPWAFSPKPLVWKDFKKWIAINTKKQKIDHPSTFSVSADGTIYNQNHKENLYLETLPSRWYRRSLAEGKGDSMWTAHFDNFCARRNLMVTHISLPQNLAAATSYRDNGEHFFDIHTPDSNLVTMKQWQSFLPFFDESNLLRLDVSGFPRSLTHRRLDDLDVNWIPDDDLDLTESQVSSLLDALAYGYDPIETVSRDQALCILQNKKIGIMGDSISRYFTFTFNYFLRTGEIPPDFDITLSDVSWGYVNGNENNGWNGVAAGVDYYDFGDLWNDEDSDFRSTRTQHRQRFETAHDSDISTTFWFIQDTWYPVLEDLIDSTINNDYDILIVNSGWWELTDSDTLDPDLTAVDCSLDGMYKNEDCLSGYESDLRNFINALLPTFSLDNKAIVWRNSNCCGDSFTQSEINDGDMRKGALAAHALNVITNDVMAELGIQTFDPSGTGNIANVGIKNQDIIDKRTFDGSHPRVWVYYAWIQVILNKIAKQLGNYDACLGTTEIPTPAPSTAAPSFKPTYSMVPTSAECSNQVRDGSETDIDCGGAQCDACEIGLSCSIDSDCITQFCLVDICVAAPTSKPTSNPTSNPTSHPTLKPTSCPTIKPALFPTSRVSTSSYPTLKPTSCPTIKPTFFPTSRVPTATGGSSSGSSIGGGDSTPIIIGAAGGGLIILLLLTLCLCCYYVRRESPSKAKRRAKRTRPDDDDEISPQISSQQQQPQKQPSESAAAARANARVMVNALLTGASMLPGIFNVSWAILAVLDEVDSMNAKAQDIVAAGQRVCDTAEFLTILNENAAGFKSDNAKVLVERYMDQLESLLKRFQDGVASFKGKGWLSRKWHNLAHNALLQKLDRDIIEVLEKLRQAYHLAMDRHVTELLSKKTYNLEAAMQQQIQLLVSKQHVTPEAAAEQLANDENVLTVVASRAGVAESDVSAERLRIREDKLKLLKAHELTLDSIEKEPFARGGQAQVHKGTFTDKVVAVKLVPLRSLSDQEIERLKSSLATEVAICTKLSRSPFIVQVYGVVNVDRNFFGMVMEYMHRGSLRTRLDDIGNYPTISEKQRLWWCRQIAAGIQFLYTNGVSHRDLKSSNVLLASRDSCKITDFGLARSEEFRTHTTQLTMRSGGVPAGTYGFMAPELLQNNEFTEKSDVYSYAMVCFEIVTRERPWRGLSLPQIMKYVADEGKRPELPLHVSAILISLIEICWKQDPNDRPTFASINQNFFPRSLSSGSSSFGSISDVDTPSFDNDSTSSMTRRSTT